MLGHIYQPTMLVDFVVGGGGVALTVADFFFDGDHGSMRMIVVFVLVNW